MKILISMTLLLGLILQSCSFTQKVKSGLQAYEVKQYAIATQLFQQEYASSRNPAEQAKLAFLAGESFNKLNDLANASTWYTTAYKDGYGDEAMINNADALKRQERYAEAISAYESLLKDAPGNASYRSAITGCKQALDWIKNPDRQMEIQNTSFNTSAAEYSAQPIGYGKVLFTSDRDSKHSSDTYLWTGRAFSDLYVWNSVAQRMDEFDSRINSPENDGTAVLSADGQMLVFTRCFVNNEYDAWCKLMISYKRDDQWSPPVALPFQVEKSNYGHPAFAANGTTLFFSADVEGGQGGHDIYFTQLDELGAWTAPVNLGTRINSEGEEEYPTVYNDTLYYSSDHFAGLGGLDIFKTYLDQQGAWTPPINLRAPINSGGDDFGFVVDTFARREEGISSRGYFTSSRGGITRNDDVFSYILHADQTKIDTTPARVDTNETPIVYQIFLSLKVVEPVFEVKDDPNSKKIENRALPNGPIVVSEGLMDQRMVTDELGQLIIKLEWNKKYTFTARYRDHLAASVSFNTGDVEKDPAHPITTFNRVLVLDPIFKNKEIVLENIFYDYDQWDIREDARPSLNNLSNVLKTNPTIRIQLSSHTDCRGTVEYNQELSQKRAQAAIDYLMSTGIPTKRLEAVGMGESSPAVNCDCEKCTEDQHQTNRRTTFKIID